MTDWFFSTLLFAQGDAAKQPDMTQFLMVVVLPIMVFFYFIVLRPQRREQATRQAMLAALKKNDRVVTIGGMIGTVANISADGEEVTLKVDDNTKVRMIRSSIQRVFAESTEPEKPAATT